MTGGRNNIDKNILYLIRQRDEKGLRQLFNLYFDELFKFTCKLTGNTEDSEDILQSVLLDLWQNGHRREIEDLKAYLIQSVKYNVYELWSQKKVITDLLDDYNEILVSESLIEKIENKELLSRVESVVKTLPDACREIFELSRFEGFSLDEIALQLNLSKQTVKNQLTKASNMVKKQLNANSLLTLTEVILIFLLTTLLF